MMKWRPRTPAPAAPFARMSGDSQYVDLSVDAPLKAHMRPQPLPGQRRVDQLLPPAASGRPVAAVTQGQIPEAGALLVLMAEDRMRVRTTLLWGGPRRAEDGCPGRRFPGAAP